MTAADLYLWMVANSTMVTIVGVGIPGLISWFAYALHLAEADYASQQVANGGIAIGLVAVTLEALAIAYAISVAKANPVTEAPAAFLVVPIYLVAAGFVVEHLIHPGEQKEIRAWIRGILMIGATLAVISAIFSVLRIYMIVLSGMMGFILFILALLAVSYVMIRRLV